MLFDIDLSDPRPVYRQIADEVRRCVSIGVLKIDEPLPAADRIAAELHVNANTVRHAYRLLEQEGAVYVKRGIGTFVSARAKDHLAGREAAALARQIAERMLREAFRHGLLASDLVAALEEISPARGGTRSRKARP